MLNEFWSILKSGSDIRGVATQGVENEEINLTNEVVEKISLAFAKWVCENMRIDYPMMTVAVGHDSRISASRIKNVVINTLRSIGVNVYDCGLTSTPAMFMANSVLDCSASIQITASHHPFHRNGFKFFNIDGGLSAKNIEEILQIAQNEDFPSITKIGNVRFVNLMEYYCEKLCKVIKDGINLKNEKPLKGFKIIVDAGNGAGGFFVSKILNPLGADTSGSIYLEPDGMFPNHVPNPENAQAMKSVSEATINSDADLGIIFDTDVDRAAFVDSEGKEISKNKLIAVSSVIALKNNPEGIIVTDSVTSDNLKAFIEKLGGTQFRYKRGYNNVIGMAQKINAQGTNCPLAIESSGHAAFKENGFVDDGAYLAAKIIVELVNSKCENKQLKDLIKDFTDAKENVSFRININGSDVDECADKLLNDLTDFVHSTKHLKLDKDNIEGVRINFNYLHQKGWMLVRKSIHDPMLVIYAESYVQDGILPMLNLVYPFFKKYNFLDLCDIEKILNK